MQNKFNEMHGVIKEFIAESYLYDRTGSFRNLTDRLINFAYVVNKVWNKGSSTRKETINISDFTKKFERSSYGIQDSDSYFKDKKVSMLFSLINFLYRNDYIYVFEAYMNSNSDFKELKETTRSSVDLSVIIITQNLFKLFKGNDANIHESVNHIRRIFEELNKICLIHAEYLINKNSYHDETSYELFISEFMNIIVNSMLYIIQSRRVELSINEILSCVIA